MKYLIIVSSIFLSGCSLQTPPVESVASFQECIDAGNPVMESYPRQCATKSGGHFVEDIGNAIEKMDKIQVVLPRPGEYIRSPLIISGKARGTWFFEASFPISLVDQDGNSLAEWYAMTSDEWMTPEFVSFETSLEFKVPTGVKTGTLLLHKDNPSGLAEYEDALEIPVRFIEE